VLLNKLRVDLRLLDIGICIKVFTFILYLAKDFGSDISDNKIAELSFKTAEKYLSALDCDIAYSCLVLGILNI
jgi:hypothetical protein